MTQTVLLAVKIDGFCSNRKMNKTKNKTKNLLNLELNKENLFYLTFL